MNLYTLKIFYLEILISFDLRKCKRRVVVGYMETLSVRIHGGLRHYFQLFLNLREETHNILYDYLRPAYRFSLKPKVQPLQDRI